MVPEPVETESSTLPLIESARSNAPSHLAESFLPSAGGDGGTGGAARATSLGGAGGTISAGDIEGASNRAAVGGAGGAAIVESAGGAGGAASRDAVGGAGATGAITPAAGGACSDCAAACTRTTAAPANSRTGRTRTARRAFVPSENARRA